MHQSRLAAFRFMRSAVMARSAAVCLRAMLALMPGAVACRAPDCVDAATLARSAGGPRLAVTILGNPGDARIVAVREAMAHWNTELRRLGRGVQLDSGTVRPPSLPDGVLAGAGREVVFGGGPATSRLRAGLAGVPGDIIVALTDTALISYGMPWRSGRAGVVVLRRSDIPPLSLPNTLRNVAAHELGHVLGLAHNLDATTLMCGRPASCRPRTFASDSAHFFPLTASDEGWIRARWP